MPLPFPAKDLVTGNAQPRERGADEVRDHSEVFSNDARSGAAKAVEHLFAEPLLFVLPRRRERSRGSVQGPEVGAVETYQVIDAVSVIEACIPPCTLTQPVEVTARQHIPPIQRKL